MTERNKHWRRWWPLILILLLVVWFISPFLRIELAQLQWNMTKPSTYRLTVHSYSKDWAGNDSTVETIVEYGRVIHKVCSISITRVVPCDTKISNQRIGVSDLFAYALNRTYQGPSGGFWLENCLRSDFDLFYGYPRWLDYNCLGVIDEAYTYQIEIEQIE